MRIEFRFSLLALLAAPCVFGQQAVGAFSPRPLSAGNVTFARPLPPGYYFQRAVAAWELGTLSAAERAPRPRFGARHIGTRRQLPEQALASPVSIALPNGRRALVASIHSEGAAAVRVHFAGFAAGAGQVWLYARAFADPQHLEVSGPYTGTGPNGNGEFWSRAIHASTVVIEFDAPAGSPHAAMPFRVDAVGHLWDSTASLPAVPEASPQIHSAQIRPDAAAASCELDVSCYANYVGYASGVVFYDFAADSGGFYACSGAMITTRTQSFEPYMLTAHHCISSTSEAQSIQAYFNYRTSTCNGPPPALSSLGSTDGGIFLAGAPIPQGDYSLVKLTGVVPPGIYYFGWTVTEPNIGDPVVGIHHPSGSWARISFGSRTFDQSVDISGSLAPANLYYQVDYNRGIIEPGSSGSPLLNASGQVVGSLTGGPDAGPGGSVCNIIPFFANYSRFSTAYPALEPYLNGSLAVPFSVSPQSLSFTETDGSGVTPAQQSISIQTQGSSPTFYSVQPADPWIYLTQSGGTISSGSAVSVPVQILDPGLRLAGTYRTSLTVAVGTGTPVAVPITFTIVNTQSRVVATINADPNPATNPVVVASVPNSSGGNTWTFGISLTESAGVATSLTGFKVAGQNMSSQLAALFGSTTLLASGSLGARVAVTNVPSSTQSLPVEIDGVDVGSGHAWTQTVNAYFANVSAPATVVVSGVPAIVRQSSSMSDCPYLQHVIVAAAGNSSVTMSRLTGAGGPDLSSQIAGIFGSTYIPAGGSVEGDLCWPIGLMNLTAADATGKSIYTSFGSLFYAAAPEFIQLRANPEAVTLGAGGAMSTAVSIDPGSSSQSWSATVIYAQPPGSWLAVTPASGAGPQSIQVSVNPAGLVPGGAYHANLLVQSMNSTPQFQTIPVTLTMPSQPFAVVNGASFAAGVSPGMAVSVFNSGFQLATGTQLAGSVPLPLKMQGTAVTVNNVPAPLYYVSPTQLNLQIPYETQPGTATLTVTNGAGRSASQQIYVNPVSPGVFLAADGRRFAPQTTVAAGGYATLFLSGQGYVSPVVATGAAPPPPSQIPVSKLPKPLANVSVFVNGVQAQTTFVGIPYFLAGVTQVNFIVPPGTPSGTQPVTVVAGNAQSNTTYIDIN